MAANKRVHFNDCGNDPPHKKVKENYKQMTGKLLSKMTISLENQIYYTFMFRLMNDNKVETYYGNSQCFKDLVEHECYNVSLNFVKTKYNARIQINEYTKCEESIDDSVIIKQSLTRADFENEEIVNVLAKLKCVFKRLNTGSYKMVFEINFQDTSGLMCVQQVECFTTVKILTSMAKAHVKNADDFNELMDFYFKNTNTIFYVHGLRCQHTINNQNIFLNWMANLATSLEIATNTDDQDYINLVNNHATNNISRSNKYIKCIPLSHFKAEQKINDNGKCTFNVQFKSFDLMEDNDENRWNRCVYYVDNNNNNNNNKDDSKDFNTLQKLVIDFDQVTTLLTDNLIKITIFITVDNVNTMNLLGLLKYDEEDCEYDFL